MFCPYLMVKNLAAGPDTVYKQVRRKHEKVRRDAESFGSWEWAGQQLAPAAVLLAVALSCSTEGSMYAYSVGKRELSTYKALPDVVHDRVPDFDHTDERDILFQAPDKLILAFTLPKLLLIMYRVWRRNDTAFVLLLRKTIVLYAVLLLLRTVTVVSTTLPSPLRSCRNHSNLGDFPPQSGTIISSIYCNDQLFSGHTSTNLLVFLLFALSDAPWWEKLVSLVLTTVALGVSIVTRDHYTVDVVVAAIVTTSLVLQQKDSLTVLLLGSIPCSIGDQVKWEIWNDNDDVVATIYAGEKRFIGREEMDNDAKVSRQHLFMEPCADCLLCTNVGRRTLERYLPELDTCQDIPPGYTFQWLPDQQVSLKDDDALFTLTLVGS